MKKIISVLLTAVLLIGAVPFSGAVRNALGAADASAIEMVDGSFDYLVECLEQYGEKDEDGDPYIGLSDIGDSTAAAVAVAYDSEDDTIILTSLVYTQSPVMGETAINITVGIERTDTEYVAAVLLATDVGNLAAGNLFNPLTYTGRNIDFQIIQADYVMALFFQNPNEEFNEIVFGILEGFDEALYESVGIGLGNFGFTVLSKPVPVPRGLVYDVSLGDIEMNYKQSAVIEPEINADINAYYTVRYKSSDTSVVTVDNNGNVYAAGRGEAEITCTVTDANGNTVETVSSVSVKFSFFQWIIWILLLGFLWY